MIIQRVIQYDDLYPEQENNLPDVNTFIKGLRREDLCVITANMMMKLAGKPFFDRGLDPGKDEFDFVRFFLSDRDPTFTQDVLKRYDAARRKLPANYNGVFIATSKPAITSFQRLFFSIKPDVNQDQSVHVEQDYFKALLLVNQKVYNAVFDGTKYSSESNDLKKARAYLAFNYANEDVEASDIDDLYRRQIAKTVSLFTFLFRSKDRRVKVLRRKFLAHFHIGSWVEYLIPHIMALYFLKKQSGLLVIKGNGEYGKKARRVVEKSCIDKNVIIPIGENLDYTAFRANPFIRMDRHHYAIISPSFVVEHMFNSVFFELKKYRADAGFLTDDDFRRYYTTEFSQKYLFEGYVKQCLPTNVEVALPGSRCDAILEKERQSGRRVDGVVPPDYYLRAPEGCIIMEYKDAFASAKVKESRDAEELFADIKEKFFENNKGKHKGITQLLDCAESIHKETFFFDQSSNTSFIYPVLVVDNPVYTMRGMRVLLEKLMRDECHKRGMHSELIRPLILMDVATIRLYSDYLNDNGLVKTFEEFYQHVDPTGSIAKHDPFESLISFTEYMKDKNLGNMQKVFDRIIHEAKPILDGYL